jgi:hypothetical protein
MENFLLRCPALNEKRKTTLSKLKQTLIQSTGQDKWTETIRVITKLPNSEQSYKGKVKTHNYINRQNQSTTGKL